MALRDGHRGSAAEWRAQGELLGALGRWGAGPEAGEKGLTLSQWLQAHGEAPAGLHAGPGLHARALEHLPQAMKVGRATGENGGGSRGRGVGR